MGRIKTFSFGLLWLCLCLATLAEATQATGILLDLGGSMHRGDSRIGIFETLRFGQTFRLDKGSQAKIGKSGTTRQWKLTGPLTFKMTEDGPLKSGSSGSISEVPQQLRTVTKPIPGVDLRKTGGVRRSMLWVTSDPGQTTTTPTITWTTASEFDSYTVELQDEMSRSIKKSTLPGNAKSFEVPAAAGLQPGMTYFVNLQGLRGARGYSASGRLRLLASDEAEALRETLESNRAAFEQTGDLSFLSLSVLELGSREIYSQLAPLLEEMARIRPDDPTLDLILERLGTDKDLDKQK